ncbi:MAG: hypothetical protein R2867_17555 [Caldilineaceae bacterium]
MGNKNYNVQDLGRLLAESTGSGRGSYTDQALQDALADQGTWITSQDQFNELYKSVDDFEKYLRS